LLLDLFIIFVIKVVRMVIGKRIKTTQRTPT